jgi:hypothetical protein
MVEKDQKSKETILWFSDPTIMGSAISHLAINPICPVLIVKESLERKNKKGKSIRWMVCTDGSKKSWNALEQVVRLMDKERDVIHGVLVKKHGMEIDNVEKSFKAKCAADKVLCFLLFIGGM